MAGKTTWNCLLLAGVAGFFGLILGLAGCSSEPAKVKVTFRVLSEKGEPMDEVQVTFLSKDNKNAEMSQSEGSGLGKVMLYPNTYGIGVNKYEGGRSAQSLRPGTKEYDDAKASGLGNTPPSNILPANLEDPLKSGLELVVKPGMDKTVDFVLKGVAEYKNPTPKKGMDISKGGKGAPKWESKGEKGDPKEESKGK